MKLELKLNTLFLLFSIIPVLISCQSKMQEPRSSVIANSGVAEKRIQTQLLVDQRLDQVNNYLISSQKVIETQFNSDSNHNQNPKPGSAEDLYKKSMALLQKAIAQAKLEAAQEMINRLMVSGAFSFETPLVSPGCKTVLYQVVMPDDAAVTELNLGFKTCNATDYIYVMKAIFDTDSLNVSFNVEALGTILKNITSVESPPQLN